MITYGLIGFPLSHSFSKAYFSRKFEQEHIRDCRYENFSFEHIDEAVAYLKNLDGLGGLNITIPHKVAVMKYLDAVSPACAEMQSCNCIRIDGQVWTGYNTDTIGFTDSLRPLLRPHHQHALIFGTGGASRAIMYSLQKLGIEFKLVSRNPGPGGLGYPDLDEAVLSKHLLLVNTTPVGMFPKVADLLPLPYQSITSQHLAYDLVYNPSETSFLREARLRGAVTKNGEEMLILQAEAAWKIWNEK